MSENMSHLVGTGGGGERGGGELGNWFLEQVQERRKKVGEREKKSPGGGILVGDEFAV